MFGTCVKAHAPNVVRKPDAVCVHCNRTIFWATMGWWLHLYANNCDTPEPKNA